MLTTDELASILFRNIGKPELYDKWVLKGRKPIYSRDIDKLINDKVKLYTRMNNKNQLACIVFVPSFTYVAGTIKSKGLFYVLEADNKILYKNSSLEHTIEYFNDWYRGLL